MSRNDALFGPTSRLISRRNALRKTLDGDLNSFGAVSEKIGVRDHVDAAVDSANDEICAQLVEIESRELAQIEHALQRIALGVYGRCESCGSKIPAARLNAVPYTSKCIKCQCENEVHGHSGAMDPDSKRWNRVFEDSIETGESEAPIDPSNFESTLSEPG